MGRLIVMAVETLKEGLSRRTKRGDLWVSEKGNGVRCFACGHRCFIPEGRDGICKVRSNVAGELRVPFNYIGALALDPIEKKPFFHVKPGARALSFGMLGCDFHCGYCQNWFTSQTLRDPSSTARPEDITADDLIGLARAQRAEVLTSTYNEPLITSEWAVEIFKKAKPQGFKTSYVSNGNATIEVLDYIRPYVDYYKIDLKGFRDKPYRQLGGVLKNITDSIQNVYRMGFWLEIVTLIIPGFNDDEGEIREMCEFLKSVSPDIPWHATAFHEDYKMQNTGDTSVATLMKAAEIASKVGLNFIYLGNLPGRVGPWENTYCPHCKAEVVSRWGFKIIENRMMDSNCPDCKKAIPGRWQL
jgi:pyruvate formate lyase activating enzyme